MNNSDSEQKNCLTIPFIDSLSNKFRGITKNINSRLTFYSINKLGNFIKVHKDSLQNTSKRNVVYKILCKDCDASYVGQTGRQLNTKVSEHRQHTCTRGNTILILLSPTIDCVIIIILIGII